MGCVCILTDNDAYFYPLHPFALLSLMTIPRCPTWASLGCLHTEINCIRDYCVWFNFEFWLSLIYCRFSQCSLFGHGLCSSLSHLVTCIHLHLWTHLWIRGHGRLFNLILLIFTHLDDGLHSIEVFISYCRVSI